MHQLILNMIKIVWMLIVAIIRPYIIIKFENVLQTYLAYLSSVIVIQFINGVCYFFYMKKERKKLNAFPK